MRKNFNENYTKKISSILKPLNSSESNWESEIEKKIQIFPIKNQNKRIYSVLQKKYFGFATI